MVKRFYAEFVTKYGGYVIDVNERKIGFKEVEQARQLYGQKISIEKVFESVSAWRTKSYLLEVPERIAQYLNQRYKLFEHENTVQVEVPVKALDKYVFIGFDFEQYDEDEVEVYPIYQMDDEQLLNAWVKAGHPLVWVLQ